MKTFYTLFKRKNVLKISVIAALGWFGTSGVNAQISGNYTIDRNGTASATVYTSFQAVIDDLQGLSRSDGGASNNTGSGVTGHATFTVASGSGPYTWSSSNQLVIPDIASMSASATVTFKGNNETINYTGSSSNRAAIKLNGADWFRFDSLNIYNVQTSSTRAWVIQFKNGADDNIVENCTVRVLNAKSTTTSTSSMNCAIVFSNNDGVLNTSQWGSNSYGNNGNRNIIRNNSIGGNETNPGGGVSYAIFLCGDGGSTGAVGNVIEDNYISNFYYRGIMMGYSASTISGNEITRPNTTSTYRWGAAMIYEESRGGGGDQTIDGNYLHHNYGTNRSSPQTFYGIYHNDAGDGTTTLTNNIISDFDATSGLYGIYYYSASQGPQYNAYHNTISFDANSSTTQPSIYGVMWRDNFGGANWRNNIVSVTHNTNSTRNHYGFYDSDWSSATFDDNIVNVNRNPGGTKDTRDYYGYKGSNMSDLAAWQMQGRGNNSQETDPNFADVANEDFKPLSFVVNNSGTSGLGITTDFNGAARSATTPDPGAIEVDIDASITAFPWTNLNVCGNFSDSVRITVKNENAFAINNVPVFFSIGTTRWDETITASIPAGGSVDHVFSTVARFNNPGANTLEAGIGVPDDNVGNSTLSYVVNVTPSPSGSQLTQDYPGTSPRVNGPIYNLAGNDVTVPGEELNYEFSAPIANSSSSYAAYTTDWTADAKIFTDAGTDVTALCIANQANSGNTYQVDIDPDVAYTDSMLTLMVTFTDVASGCDSTYEKQVLVAPRGMPDFSFPATICEGEGVLFDNFATVSSGFLEYEWRFKDGSTILGTAESTNPVYTFPSSGTYEVEMVTVTNPHGYRDSLTKTVTVTPIPTVDFTRVNACEGENIVLTNNSTPTDANFTWDFGDGSATVSTTNATKTYAPGGYAVTLTAEKNGCAASLTKNVYQFARPVANAAVVSGECDNDEFTFQNNSTISVGNTGYLWDFDEPNSVSTAVSPTYDFQTPGVKNVRLRAVSEFGCEDTLDMPLVVNVKEAPKAQFAIDQTCSETPSTFTNNSTTPSGATNSYSWTIEGNTATNNNPSFTHVWSSLGSQVVTLVATSDNGCEDTRVENVEVLIQPKADFLIADVCEGEEVQLTNLTTWPAGNISYAWDMPAASPAASTDGSPKITVTANPGNYNFKLTATIEGGCSSEKIVPVEVKPLPETCGFSVDADFANGPNNFDLTPTGGSLAGTNYKWIVPYNGSPSTNATGLQDVKFPEGSLETITIRMVADRNGCACESTQTLQLTNTDALPNGGEFKVYPNPTAGKLNVEVSNNTETLEIAVYNSVGVQVATVNTNNVNNGVFEINLDGLAAGLYIVKVKTGGETSTKRITLTK